MMLRRRCPRLTAAVSNEPGVVRARGARGPRPCAREAAGRAGRRIRRCRTCGQPITAGSAAGRRAALARAHARGGACRPPAAGLSATSGGGSWGAPCRSRRRAPAGTRRPPGTRRRAAPASGRGSASRSAAPTGGIEWHVPTSGSPGISANAGHVPHRCGPSLLHASSFTVARRPGRPPPDTLPSGARPCPPCRTRRPAPRDAAPAIVRPRPPPVDSPGGAPLIKRRLAERRRTACTSART